jgi:hypothetical protein
MYFEARATMVRQQLVLEYGWRIALMRLNRKNQATENREPMGIVIADGGVPETATRFLAYVWGPVPDDDDEDISPLSAPLLAATA